MTHRGAAKIEKRTVVRITTHTGALQNSDHSDILLNTIRQKLRFVQASLGSSYNSLQIVGLLPPAGHPHGKRRAAICDNYKSDDSKEVSEPWVSFTLIQR